MTLSILAGRIASKSVSAAEDVTATTASVQKYRTSILQSAQSLSIDSFSKSRSFESLNGTDSDYALRTRSMHREKLDVSFSLEAVQPGVVVPDIKLQLLSTTALSGTLGLSINGASLALGQMDAATSSIDMNYEALMGSAVSYSYASQQMLAAAAVMRVGENTKMSAATMATGQTELDVTLALDASGAVLSNYDTASGSAAFFVHLHIAHEEEAASVMKYRSEDGLAEMLAPSAPPVIEQVPEEILEALPEETPAATVAEEPQETTPLAPSLELPVLLLPDAPKASPLPIIFPSPHKALIEAFTQMQTTMVKQLLV